MARKLLRAKVELSSHKGTALMLAMIYGLSDDKPMMLLTNKQVKYKKDVYKILRSYMER